MRFSTSSGYAAVAAIAIASLAACSGSGSPVAALPSAGSAAMQLAYDASSPTAIAYISDAIEDTVTAYSSNGKIKLRILKYLKTPGGLFVDSSHNLWVANGGGNVVVFAPGASKPKLTLDAPGLEPTDVTICPNGTVYVAADGAPIAVYSRGSTKPTRRLSYPGGQVSNVTCDAAGNIFATGVVAYRSAILEFPKGKAKGAKVLAIKGLVTPNGIRMDAAGTKLLISDQSQYTITEFTESGKATGHKINTTSGASCITFGVATDGTIGCPVYFANPVGTTVGATFTFPAGKALQTYTNPLFGQPYGFAFDSDVTGK
jgi:sugar lactone lactonase YvrE